MGNMNGEFLFELVKDYRAQVSEANNAARLDELDRIQKITPFKIKEHTLEQCFALAYYNEALASQLLNNRKFFKRLQKNQAVNIPRYRANNRNPDLNFNSDNHFKKLEEKYSNNLNILALISKNARRRSFPQDNVGSLLNKYVYNSHSKTATTNFRYLLVNFQNEIIDGLKSEREVCLIRNKVVKDPQLNRWLKHKVENNPEEKSVKFLVTVASITTINKILNPGFFDRFSNLFSRAKLPCEFVTAKDLIARIKFEHEYSLASNRKFDIKLIENFLNSNVLKNDIWRTADEDDWKEIILIIDQLSARKDNKLLKLAKSRYKKVFPRKLSDLEIDSWKISEPHSIEGLDSAPTTPRNASSRRSSADLGELVIGSDHNDAIFFRKNNLDPARGDVRAVSFSPILAPPVSRPVSGSPQQMAARPVDPPVATLSVASSASGHDGYEQPLARIDNSPASLGLQELFTPADVDGLESPRNYVGTQASRSPQAIGEEISLITGSPYAPVPTEIDGLESPRERVDQASRSQHVTDEQVITLNTGTTDFPSFTPDSGRSQPAVEPASPASFGLPEFFSPAPPAIGVDKSNAPRPQVPSLDLSVVVPQAAEVVGVDGLDSPRTEVSSTEELAEAVPSVDKSGEIEGFNSPRGQVSAAPVESILLVGVEGLNSPRREVPPTESMPSATIPGDVDGLDSPRQPASLVVPPVETVSQLAAPAEPVVSNHPPAQASSLLATPLKAASPEAPAADRLSAPVHQATSAVAKGEVSPLAVTKAVPAAVSAEPVELSTSSARALSVPSTPVQPEPSASASTNLSVMRSSVHQVTPAVAKGAISPLAVTTAIPAAAVSAETAGLSSPQAPAASPLPATPVKAAPTEVPAVADRLKSPEQQESPIVVLGSTPSAAPAAGLNSSVAQVSSAPSTPAQLEQPEAATADLGRLRSLEYKTSPAVAQGAVSPSVVSAGTAGLNSPQVPASPKLGTPVKAAMLEAAPASADTLKTTEQQASPIVVLGSTPSAAPAAGLNSSVAQVSSAPSTPAQLEQPVAAIAELSVLTSPQHQASPAVAKGAASPTAGQPEILLTTALSSDAAVLSSPQVQASPVLATPVKATLPDAVPVAVDGLKSSQQQASPIVAQGTTTPIPVPSETVLLVADLAEKLVLCSPPVIAAPSLATPVKATLPEAAHDADILKSLQHEASPLIAQLVSPNSVTTLGLNSPQGPASSPVPSIPLKEESTEKATAVLGGVRSPEQHASPAVAQSTASPMARQPEIVLPVAADMTGLSSPQVQASPALATPVKAVLLKAAPADVNGLNSPDIQASPTRSTPEKAAPLREAPADEDGFNSPLPQESPKVLPALPAHVAADKDVLNSPGGFNSPQQQNSLGGLSSPKARTLLVDGLPSPIPKVVGEIDGFSSPVVGKTLDALPAEPPVDGLLSPVAGDLEEPHEVSHISSITPPPKPPAPKMTAEERREAYKKDPSSTPNIMEDDMAEFSFNESSPMQPSPKKDSARKKAMQRSGQSSPSLFKPAAKTLFNPANESLVHDPEFTEIQYSRMKRLYGAHLKSDHAERLWSRFYKGTPAFDSTQVKNPEFTEEIYYRVIERHDEYLTTSQAESFWLNNKNNYQNDSDDESNNSHVQQHDVDDEDKSESSNYSLPGMQPRASN